MLGAAGAMNLICDEKDVLAVNEKRLKIISYSGLHRSFHTIDDQIQLAYIDRLVDIAGDLGAEVIVSLIDRLRGVLPEDDPNQRVLDVVEQNVQWQAHERRGVV